MSISEGKIKSSACFFFLFFFFLNPHGSSLMCVAAPGDILGVSGMAVFVYLELAGTTMLSGARPGLAGGVFPAAILLRL